ncbi:MAG: mechanosensitive ion channel family protein [Gemmatimonadetes bacterium]|nr:mechanosensitive ion channel family protein [Gemmatimonadota bacterium]
MQWMITGTAEFARGVAQETLQKAVMFIQSPSSGGAELLGMDAATQGRVLSSVLVIIILFVLRRALLAVVSRRVEDPTSRYRWAKTSAYTASLIGLAVVIQIWFIALRSLSTFLGLLSAGLAIALRDLVADFAGWLFILFRRPFDLGDRIQIGSHAGDVIDRRIFQFSIMEIGNWVGADQSTGRVIHIPNQRVFLEPLANYSAGFPYLWNELKVLVTLESDWKKAKTLFAEITKEITKDVVAEAQGPGNEGDQRFLIHYRTLTPAVYTSVEESGVLLTVRYLCRPRERRGTSEALWEEILQAVSRTEGIELAYPTQRLVIDPNLE